MVFSVALGAALSHDIVVGMAVVNIPVGLLEVAVVIEEFSRKVFAGILFKFQ